MKYTTLMSTDKMFASLIKLLIVIVLLSVLPLDLMADSVGCDDAFVQLDSDSLVIKVTGTGGDDTANIQCALDVAVSTGIPTVALASGEFYISSITIENFNGTLQGHTKTTTFINTRDRSVDCDLMISEGREPSVIKFVKGEPRIRYMTIRASHTCMGDYPISNVLHFTGKSANSADCSNDTLFGAVDRVILDGLNIDNAPLTGVSVEPESTYLGGCQNTLLGTFKLNRSTVQNFYWGVLTIMKSGAQVDINFNEFHHSSQAIGLYDTNQNTTITSNKFFGENTPDYDYFAIAVNALDEAGPTTTRVVIDNNEFNVSSQAESEWYSYAIAIHNHVRPVNVSCIVTNNRFNLTGPWTSGLYFDGVSNTHVSANRFTGSAGEAISVFADDAPASGWTITANQGLASFSSAYGTDIYFGPGVSNSIVGPDQGTDLDDNGTNNTLLPQ